MSLRITTPVLGNAAAGDVRAGKTFSGTAVTPGTAGTLPTQTSPGTITPGTSNQSFPAGIYDSGWSVKGDPNLVPGNIAQGVSIFGVTGTSVQAAGNATPAQVLTGYTFTSAGASGTQNGTMPNNGAVILTPSGTGTVSIPAGYHNGSGYVAQVSVPAANVLTGTTIAGVAGTMPNHGSPTWTPGTSNQSLAAGYYSGGTVQGDGNLQAGNIRSGVSIFGVSGNVTPRQYAQGTTSCSGGTVTFYCHGTSGNQSLYYVTVSGLGFQPSLIFIFVPVTGAITVYAANANIDNYGDTIYCASGGLFYLDGSSAYVNGGTFQLPISKYQTGSNTIYWEAYL
ncbi:hypothetical protein SD51_12210 [Alicyclobacillus tengchongensis]|nr:hypothetical protein SD51_12210 [Alicyclobacillus tengchongensis]